jgi:hypothetical protein
MMCKKLPIVTMVLVAAFVASTAFAQCGCGPTQTTYAPVVSSQTAYYVPAATYYAPVPRVAYYAAPPVATYATYYAPAPQPYTTYYAPAPQPYVAYYGALGSSIYGTPRVYMPGQPVRNVLRAVTP